VNVLLQQWVCVFFFATSSRPARMLCNSGCVCFNAHRLHCAGDFLMLSARSAFVRSLFQQIHPLVDEVPFLVQ
jgi:hypothetical protein